jgi:hypothetical protein
MEFRALWRVVCTVLYTEVSVSVNRKYLNFASLNEQNLGKCQKKLSSCDSTETTVISQLTVLHGDFFFKKPNLAAIEC